jgi:hypothetical protein
MSLVDSPLDAPLMDVSEIAEEFLLLLLLLKPLCTGTAGRVVEEKRLESMCHREMTKPRVLFSHLYHVRMLVGPLHLADEIRPLSNAIMRASSAGKTVSTVSRLVSFLFNLSERVTLSLHCVVCGLLPSPFFHVRLAELVSPCLLWPLVPKACLFFLLSCSVLLGFSSDKKKMPRNALLAFHLLYRRLSRCRHASATDCCGGAERRQLDCFLQHGTVLDWQERERTWWLRNV